MNEFIDSFAYWFADCYLTTTVLLAAVLVAIRCCRQPVKRLAVAKAAIVSTFALAGLCALPGWSIVSLGWPVEKQMAALTIVVAPPVDRSRASMPTSDLPRTPIEFGGKAPAPFVAPPVNEAVAYSWQVLVVWSCVLGLGAVVMWLLAGVIAARRMVRRARSAPKNLNDLFQRIAGSREAAAELLISDELDVAVALGVLRPRVLLPQRWTTSCSASELSTVLEHEVAHIRNGDLTWLAASRALLVLEWAQPMYWLLRRSMRLDQEALADAAAAEHAGRQQYAEQLVSWARGVSTRRKWMLPAAVGLWEGPSQLRRRLTMLLDDQMSILRRCSRVWEIVTAVVVAASATLLSTATLGPLAISTAGEVDSGIGGMSSAGVRTLPNGTKVEILAIGGKSDSGSPDRWWRPDGTPLVSVPFRTISGRISNSDFLMARQCVMFLSDLPLGATVRSRGIHGVGMTSWPMVMLDGQRNPPGYYSALLRFARRQAGFGLRIDVAAGEWQTIETVHPQGETSFRFGDHTVGYMPQAFSITVPHWGESTAVVIAHNTPFDQDVRMVAVDKAGKQHTAGQTSTTSVGDEGSVLTQFDFRGLKLDDVDHFELQSREIETIVFNELPAQPNTKHSPVEFQALASDSPATED